MSAANDWNLQWLQRMRAINGGPLPVVNDQRPWESQYQAMQAPVPSWGGLNQAAQDTGAPNSLEAFQRQVTASPFMKQDTAAGESAQGPMSWLDEPTDMNRNGGRVPVSPGESAQGPWSDNTTRLGGAQASASNPSAWDANDMGDLGGAQWVEGRGWVPTGQGLQAGYQLGQTGAYLPVAYNATNDVDRHEWSGKASEPSWRRVNRWAGDYQRQGMGAQEAYNAALARLKHDYEVTGADWRRSGFDLSSIPSGGAAATSGPAPGRGDQQNQGGSTVGPNDPLNPYNTPTGSTGTQPGGTGLGVIPPSTAGKSNFGGAGFINQGNPEQVTRQYMQSHNMNPDGHGFFGDFIRKLMGNLVPALMSLTLDQNGKPAMDQLANPGSFLDPIFFGGAGTLGANLGNFANRAQAGLASAMPGMEADTQASLLRNLTALRTVGMNPYLGQATNNRLDTGINRAKDYAFGLAQQGQDTPDEWNLMDFINSLQGRR